MLQLPGGISMSRLKVYATPAPDDGQRGGTPHVHLLCSELYSVLGGSGAVELIDAASGFTRVELHAGDALLFKPGTLHRLINPRGDLEILVIMQHGGLPERGDNVACFSDSLLADDDAFADAMRAATLADAYGRRDRGVTGFLALKAAFATDANAGQTALRRFLTLALARTAAARAEWDAIVQGEIETARDALDQLEALGTGDMTALLNAEHAVVRGGTPASIGYCGQLFRYPAQFQPEGAVLS